jgi:hypothetical protein
MGGRLREAKVAEIGHFCFDAIFGEFELCI